MAILFGCERFYQYVFGKNFVIESDHKPLESIFKKPLNDCPPRLQRLRMKLLEYDLTVKYKPGKELHIADALSRCNIADNKDVIYEDIELQVMCITEQINISKNQLEKFKKETANDISLQTVINFVRNGWPDQKCYVNEEAKPFFTFRENLYEKNNLLFNNNCIVVPNSLRKEMLNCIHYNHMGIEKCKLRARECLYWPGMSNDIENVVSNCVFFSPWNTNHCFFR